MSESIAKENEKITVIYESELLEIARAKAYKIVMRAHNLKTEPKGNIAIQLKEWRKLGDDIIKYFENYGNVMKKVGETYTDLQTATARNNNARWTQDEDEKLIELVCDGSWTIYEIANSFGRSVPAIKTRVSNLVGLNRLSKKIAGRFIGTIDGAEIDGDINGIVYRGKPE